VKKSAKSEKIKQKVKKSLKKMKTSAKSEKIKQKVKKSSKNENICKK